MRCAHCDNKRWVCENHPDRPWEGVNACTCGGAGMPCLACNSEQARRPPTGMKTDVDKKGWRH
jgi:hypothetical protein